MEAIAWREMHLQMSYLINPKHSLRKSGQRSLIHHGGNSDVAKCKMFRLVTMLTVQTVTALLPSG
jgi:hypothetical protein